MYTFHTKQAERLRDTLTEIANLCHAASYAVKTAHVTVVENHLPESDISLEPDALDAYLYASKSNYEGIMLQIRALAELLPTLTPYHKHSK